MLLFNKSLFPKGIFSVFFFNDTATTEIYTLSLHDALPIWGLSRTSPRDQARFMLHLDRFIPRRHRHFAMRQLSHIVPGQRWGVGRVRHRGWALYFKGGWGSGSGRVDHQVVLLRRGGHRLALAIFTQFDPDH